VETNLNNKKLSEIAVILNGYAFKSSKYVSEGIRIIRIANVQNGYIIDDAPCFYPIESNEDISKYYLYENDMLISLTGNVGRVGILKKQFLPAALNQRVSCIRVKPKLVANKYLFYYLSQNSFINECINASKGVAQLNLSTKWLSEYVIPLPPLADQHRIVTKIEELFSQLDSGVETLKKTKQQLAVYRQAVYVSAYENISSLDSIAKHFDISSGLTKNSNREEMPIKMSYLRVANVYYNRLDLTEIKQIGVREDEIENTTLYVNDLLFVEGNGSKEQIGRVAIWDGSIENCLHQNHIIKARPKGDVFSKFALYYLISKFGRKQILSVSSCTSGLYTLSTNKIKSLKIPICDKKTQKSIINNIEEKISVCDSIEKTVDEALQQAEALRQSILKKAFEGGL